MKRFRFPLRPVAVLRAHRELQAREAFAAAVHAYVKSEQDLAATRERVALLEKSLFAGRTGIAAGAGASATFSAAGEGQALAAYRREWAAEAEAERATHAARATMQQKRVEYLEAHRKHEVVKRLEEKARAAHWLEAGREEQAGQDDFAGRRLAGRRTLFST